MNAFFRMMIAAVAVAVIVGTQSAFSAENVPDHDGMTVKGMVACNGHGIAGAVVSDGTNVTKTDVNGCYWLPTDISKAEFVMLSTPRGYEVETYGAFLPRFFYPIDKSATGVQRFDFDLNKTDDQDNYVLVVVADEHVSGRVLDVPKGSGNVVAPIDSLQYHDVFVPKLAEYVKSFPAGTKFYGLNLGDMTHSEYWFRNNADMDAYVRLSETVPFQMYHTIGNHDHCHKYEDDYRAEAEYRRHFGPTYYSFNLGNVHYVVLDDMLYHGGNRYDRIVTSEQIEWLKKDLAALDPTVRRLVVAAHVPFTKNAATYSGYAPNLENWDELYDVICKYDVMLLTGDWHASSTVLISERMTEYVHPSLCGTWWYRPLCTDGTPASFVEYRFEGDSLLSRHTVPYLDMKQPCQYTLFNKGVTVNTGTAVSAKDDPAGGVPAILVNFWNYNTSWDFVCRENGRIVRGHDSMVRVFDPAHRCHVDDGHIEVERYPWCRSHRVAHMFRYVPADPEAEIEIVATDYRHGGRTITINTRIEN